MGEPTKKQTWALFCMTGKDYRGEISFEEASILIDKLKAQQEKDKVNQIGLFQQAYDTAYAAGEKALNECSPRPMTVQQHADPMNDQSPVTQEWHVSEGVCGFAWINIRPATCKFAKFLLQRGVARVNSYEGGVQIWVDGGGQSYERKVAFANAFASTLRDTIGSKPDFGVRTIFPGSRLD